MRDGIRRWRGLAAATLVLAGCAGLGESPSDSARTNKPRSRQAVQPATADLRIPADNVAQAPKDIPLVPLPATPTSRPAQTARMASPPASPQSAPPSTPTTPPAPPAQQAAPTQADGSQAPTPLTARQLLERANARCANLNSYIVRLTRRESTKGKPGPEEIIAFSFRKEPFSVHLKWLGKTAEGREVLYVKGRFDNKIHTKLAAGDAPLMPAGTRMSLSPDNPLVRSASRHPITDAGVEHCVATLIDQLNAQERGDRRRGTITVLPPQRRPEYPQPVETLLRVIPPGVEPQLPRGGRRFIYFDPAWQLPMLVVSHDDKGNEVEYYHYDRLQANVPLDDDDFNPDKLWPQKTRPSEPRP
jgi:hypothetical protein